MGNLIDIEDFIKASKLKNVGIAKIMMQMMQINKINKIYANTSKNNGHDFITEIIKELKIKYDVSDTDLNKIPSKNSFISISNHPYGGIDGIILLDIMLRNGVDFKVMANFLLQKIEPITDYIIPINPWENKKEIKSNISGLKTAITHIENNGALGIFPAGEVSSYNFERNKITDKEWGKSAMKFIKNAQVPILPIHFQGTNSFMFHLLGMFDPTFRTAKLPSELFKKNDIKLRIGNPILLKDINQFDDIYQFSNFLRAKTYALGTDLEVKKFFYNTIYRNKTKVEPLKETITAPISNEILINEVNNIDKINLLFQVSEFNVYCATSYQIPNILKEIGRLREITFRQIGEGTNKSIDIDEYDIYYNHLFIWDTSKLCIVGAYRLGLGQEIISEYGAKGFYIKKLFKISTKFESILKKSIEVGRSFIVKEYQLKPMPLFLLWKGILFFLLKQPEYRYLIGPVSISNDFSSLSKTLIIKHIEEKYFDKNISKHIKPRKKFKIQERKLDPEIVNQATKNDLASFDKFIEDFEPNNLKIPVLLKKYLKLNAKIIGFNVDPLFNNSLDGLVFLDLNKIPKQTIKVLSKELSDESILIRFKDNK